MGIISIKEIGVPKSKQIINSIESAIINKTIKKGDKLPSINSIKTRFSISRDTVLNAYSDLKTRGIIQSVAGKGYYLIKEEINTSKKIFLLFDELNAFKEDLYKSFVANLPSSIEVDIFFHHFNSDVFRNTIINNVGDYSYYIIMPANLKETSLVINHLPEDKVYILDQIHDDLLKYPAIFQNFEKGIFNCLNKLKSKLTNYERLVLVFDYNKQPTPILNGVKSFCLENNIPFEIVETKTDLNIQKKHMYMTLDDASLITVVKQIRVKEMKISKDVGIIAYNDTPLKEIIDDGITVISNDFKEMGEKLAKMLLTNSKEKIENEIYLTIRKSV